MNKTISLKLGDGPASVKVFGIKCPKCDDIVYSRARHDMRYCSCGDVAIDGGRAYEKVAYRKESPARQEILLMGTTEKDLEEDWASRRDKFGIIHPKRNKV